jgi:hypothetical protein
MAPEVCLIFNYLEIIIVVLYHLPFIAKDSNQTKFWNQMHSNASKYCLESSNCKIACFPPSPSYFWSCIFGFFLKLLLPWRHCFIASLILVFTVACRGVHYPVLCSSVLGCVWLQDARTDSQNPHTFARTPAVWGQTINLTKFLPPKLHHFTKRLYSN